MQIIEFKEKIETFKTKALELKPLIHNEENTKQSLINPFLLLLGYDVHNQNEVEFEFNASFTYKNSDKVDYAIKSDGKPLFFIEAKKAHDDLTAHNAQLEYYLSTNNDVQFGILTNGVIYKFFYYFEKQKTMDKEPFFVFDFENITDESIEVLKLMCKDDFDMSAFLKKGEELWLCMKTTQKLKELLRKPSDEFIRLLAKESISQKITAPILEKLRPIVNKSISNDFSQDTLIEESTLENGKTIVTTDKELKAFEMTKDILLRANKDVTNVDYKDTVSYFGIYNRNISGWFVRFILDQQPHIIMVKLDYMTANEIPSDLKLQPLTSKGITKIFIESLNDIDKLEPFILKAFEVVE